GARTDTDAAIGALVAETAGAAAAGARDVRAALATAGDATGVRGIVVDGATGTPLGGVEVLALGEPPSLQPLIQRFRGLFEGGMFVETRRPPRVLGSAFSGGDGTFEIL